MSECQSRHVRELNCVSGLHDLLCRVVGDVLPDRRIIPKANRASSLVQRVGPCVPTDVCNDVEGLDIDRADDVFVDCVAVSYLIRCQTNLTVSAVCL